MEKSKTKDILAVSIDRDLKAAVQEQAKKEGRNVSNMVTFLLRKGLKKEKAA